MRSGRNTLYAVVRDRYILNERTNVGGYGQTGLFVAAVPEPGALVSLLSGITAVWVSRSVRRRRSGGRPGDTRAVGLEVLLEIRRDLRRRLQTERLLEPGHGRGEVAGTGQRRGQRVE